MTNEYSQIQNSRIDSLIKKTKTWEIGETIPQIISKLDQNRTEIFALKNNNCYFIHNQIILDKKKIHPSMKIDSESQSIPFLKTTDKISKTVDIFLDYKVNSVPVLNHKKIVGEVRILSVLEKFAQLPFFSRTKIKELKTENAPVSFEKSISFVRKKLKQSKINALPVEKKGRITHIITTNDIIGILNPPQKVGKLGTKGKEKIRSLEPQVGNIGTKLFPKCGSEESLKNAVLAMTKSKKNYCLINYPSGKSSLLTPHNVLELCREETKRKIPIQILGKRKKGIIGIVSSKLEKILEKYSNVKENVVEVRVSLEEQKNSGNETLYITNLLLITQNKQCSFSAKSWSLEKGIAEIGEKISGKISSSRKRNKLSIRKKSKEQILSEISS